jgi:meso-butanediol dehydrogenase / (S,S)-butanediol dehydrogenase / diacetyl reductase
VEEGDEMTKLAGKVALITGAGQGVGQGIAFALAAEGARIAVTGRTAAKLSNTCEEIRRRGGEAEAFACDVKSADDIARTVAAVVKRFGKINILVNNAQEVPLGLLNEVTEQAYVDSMESGPHATFRLMRACYPYLKGDGTVINLGTAAALRWDSAGYGVYAAAKEAIRQLTRAAACEWGVDGIRVNCVLPLAASPALADWIRDRPEESAAFLATVPLRRVGDCEQDIGRAVAFLCSPEASYITGLSLPLDGGQARLV